METEVPEEKLREFFNKLTASSGGKLSLDGFLKLNYQLYLNRTEKEAKKQFSRLDKDESDYLDFEEVKTLLEENWVLLPERRKELRAQLDKFTDDDYLTMEVLNGILTQYGSDPIDEDTASTFISDVDWNADGRISKDELTAFLLKNPEWVSENIGEDINGDKAENENETNDTNVEMEKESPQEGEYLNEETSEHGEDLSDSEESSQGEVSEDDGYDASQVEKTSDDDKATRKAEKEAKKQAKKEAKRAKKAARKAKKESRDSNKSADDPDAEENET